MIWKVELDSTFSIIQTVCRRSSQTLGTDVSICLRRGVDLSVIVSQTDRRPLQIIWKPGFKAKSTGVSLIRKANVNIVVRFYFGLKSRC